MLTFFYITFSLQTARSLTSELLACCSKVCFRAAGRSLILHLCEKIVESADDLSELIAIHNDRPYSSIKRVSIDFKDKNTKSVYESLYARIVAYEIKWS